MAFCIAGKDKYGEQYYCKYRGQDGEVHETFDSFLTTKFATKVEAAGFLLKNQRRLSRRYPDIRAMEVREIRG